MTKDKLIIEKQKEIIEVHKEARNLVSKWILAGLSAQEVNDLLVAHKKTHILESELISLDSTPDDKQGEKMTALEILKEHRNYLEDDNTELYSEYEILKAMYEYADQFASQRKLTDEEIERWADSVDIISELHNPKFKSEDDLSPFGWAVFAAKAYRDGKIQRSQREDKE
jgi:hypothetical protein